MNDKTINVGVIGLGMMGLTHLDVYTKIPGVKVVALAERDAERLAGWKRAAGNIDGQAKSSFDYGSVAKYPEGMDLLSDPNVHVVDICLPTPHHVRFAKAALAAGKHVLLEKPVAPTFADAESLAAAAEQSECFLMVAMCMRFWPGWDWLKDAVDQKKFGKVLGAHFRRVATLPPGPFYKDGTQCGGAILDLHVHDTDFIQYLFGRPRAVHSSGYSKVTGRIDHVTTQYYYDDVPLVVAEGGWAMAEGFPFSMQYTVNFEQATAVFDLAAKHPLTVYRAGQPAEPIAIASGMGYEFEIAYFIDCIRRGERPTRVSAADAATAIRIIEAEVHSVTTGETVAIPWSQKPDREAVLAATIHAARSTVAAATRA